MNEKAIADPSLIPNIETFEERVAILIFEGGIQPQKAGDLAAQAQGFTNQNHYWFWLTAYVENQGIG